MYLSMSVSIFSAFIRKTLKYKQNGIGVLEAAK